MSRIVMFVYGDISTDARVQRAAAVVADTNDLTLVSLLSSHPFFAVKYKQEYVRGHGLGRLGLFYALSSAVKIIRKIHPDIVYCHDYFSALLVYYLLKTKYPGKIVYDAHEIIIPETGQIDKRQRFFYWFERRIVKHIDLLVCASLERSELMENHYHLSTSPLVIPNVSVLSVSSDLKVYNYFEAFEPFWGINKKTIVYAGVVSKGRRLELLLNAVAKKSAEFKLLIVGGGSFLEELKNLAASYPSLDVCFMGTVPYSYLGSILSRCDIGYLYYPTDTLNNKYCASNKLYEYSSVSLPVVSNNNPTIKAFFEKYRIGYASDDLVYAIDVVESMIDEMKNNCLLLNAENHWEIFSKKLLEAIQSL